MDHVLWKPLLDMFDKKYSNIVNYLYNLKKFFFLFL